MNRRSISKIRIPAGKNLWRQIFLSAALSMIFGGSEIIKAETNYFGFSEKSPEPQIFAPGIISTRDYERDGTFTPDGKTFFYTKRTIWSYFSAICVSYYKNGDWTEPEVAPFSGQYPDAMPFISPDGTRLYFASRRPENGGPEAKRDFDIWFVERTSTGWGSPQRLPAPINTPNHELSPIVTRNGSLYFLSSTSSNMMRAAKSSDGSGGWLPPEIAGDPNEPGSADTSGYVDPDERFMIVSVVGRKDALATQEGLYPRADLYVRERKDDKWGALQHLPAPINSNAEEITPTITPDGKYLLFMSERGSFTEHGTRRWTFDEVEQSLRSTGNGLGDIYKIDVQALGGDLAGKIQSSNNSEAMPPPVSPLSSSKSGRVTTQEDVPPAVSSARKMPSDVPRLFGENVISTSDDEFSGAFTPDGETVYFNKSAPRSYRYIIVESHWRNGKWTKPVVAPFSGQYSDSDPVLSPDGTKLFWSSDRPVDGKIKHDYDIWMVTRTPNGGWSEPVHLPEPINSDGSEYYASITRDGTLYFSSDRDGGQNGAIQAYRSKFVNNTWTAAENVSKMIDGPKAPGYYDLDVFIAPDESYIVLSSIGRPGGFGNFDLYIAWKRGEESWSPAVHLPAPFNTIARDYSPHLSSDGKQFYFSSERGFALNPINKPLSYRELIANLRGTLNGSGNLYQVDASVLDSFRAP